MDLHFGPTAAREQGLYMDFKEGKIENRMIICKKKELPDHKENQTNYQQQFQVYRIVTRNYYIRNYLIMKKDKLYKKKTYKRKQRKKRLLENKNKGVDAAEFLKFPRMVKKQI